MPKPYHLQNDGFLVDVNSPYKVATAIKKVVFKRYPKKLLINGTKKLANIENNNQKRYQLLGNIIENKFKN